MNEKRDTNADELEHCDERGAVAPSHEDTQRACAIVNSIEQALVARLDQVDAQHGPGTCHRLGLHRHVLHVLAEHRAPIANALAGNRITLPFVVGVSTVGDPTRVCASTPAVGVYDDPARGYGSVYGPDPTKTLVCDASVADADGSYPPFAE